MLVLFERGGLWVSAQCLFYPTLVEDDAHAVVGCAGTCSAVYVIVAFRALVTHGASPWAHSAPTPVGLASSPYSSFDRRHYSTPPPKSYAGLAPKLLHGIHLGMVEHVSEVLRRREE